MKRIALNETQVKAILSGATELRVPVRPQPWRVENTWQWGPKGYMPEGVLSRGDHCVWGADVNPTIAFAQFCPYPIGSEVALTETWQHYDWTEDGYHFIRYKADLGTVLFDGISSDEFAERLGDRWADLSDPKNYKIDGRAADRKWRPAITMPAEFSRFIRRVAGVRVEHGEQWEWVLTLEEVKHG